MWTRPSLLLNPATPTVAATSVFIYAGPTFGSNSQRAITNDTGFRQIAIGEASGIPAAFYFLPADPREVTPMLVNLIHLKTPFNRMKLRHDLWKQRYPDSMERHGIPWTGIANASAELRALANPRVNLQGPPLRSTRVHRAPRPVALQPEVESRHRQRQVGSARRFRETGA